MKAIAVVGMKGTGKTTEVKKIITRLNAPRYVYDVNAEYSKNPLPDFETFAEKMRTKTNSVIVFEEAAIFFSNRGTFKALREIMIRTRHTNNFVIFVFHSLRQIPIDIFEGLNMIALKKTNDREDLLKSKYKDNPFIIPAWNSVMQDPDRFKTINLMIQ